MRIVHRIVVAILVATVAVVAITPAQAKRRGGGTVIPIPGSGGSESIELVTRLDNVPALHYEDDTYIDLGYLHSGSDSRWVGYVGSSKTFLDPGHERMALIIQAGGLSAFPPVPEQEIPWKGLAIVAGFALLFNLRRVMRMVRGGVARHARHSARTAFEKNSRSAVDWDAVDARIAEATASGGTRSDPAPRPRQRRQAVAAGGGFGRRGL